MCGIFGEFSVQGDLLERPQFDRLLQLSTRRGPDGSRVWGDSHAQLGFNRLAILELSDRAMQPLVSPSGRYHVVFNGEIFKFRELAKRHGLDRDSLCLTSDAVLLAHLCDVMDVEELAAELDGMFGIGIYDSAERRLFLIRDFAGIKPLFYGLSSSKVVFASQFDQVCSPSGIPRRKSLC